MWISWALLDLRNGAVSGSANQAETTMTASMVKAWIAADYLTRFGMSALLNPVIRDSANEPAWQLYNELGREESIQRMIDICGLTDSSPGEDLSMTLMSARDTVRLGRAISDGTAAGNWTPWLLEEMRQVRGRGDFGIRHAFAPAVRQTIAIKNGWDKRVALGLWNVNCLAISKSWVMAALTRYPQEWALSQGAQTCEDLAAGITFPRDTPDEPTPRAAP